MFQSSRDLFDDGTPGVAVGCPGHGLLLPGNCQRHGCAMPMPMPLPMPPFGPAPDEAIAAAQVEGFLSSGYGFVRSRPKRRHW